MDKYSDSDLVLRDLGFVVFVSQCLLKRCFELSFSQTFVYARFCWLRELTLIEVPILYICLSLFLGGDRHFFSKTFF